MFRRNRSRRPFRRWMGVLFNPNGALGTDARQLFDEANDLYDKGQYAQAAEQFAHLAEVAQSFDRPRRVMQLHLRAFDAWVKAKDGDKALNSARAALAIANARPRKAAQIAEAVIADLRANGFNAQATTLINALGAALGIPQPSVASSGPAAPAPQEPAPKPLKFPTTCPQCGGRLPKAFGEDELECDYCGTVVRGE